MTTVYIDVLFLINFALDYMVIFLCGKLFHLRMKRSRNILISIAMAIYAVWALLYCRSYILLLATALCVLVLACAVTYKIKRTGLLLKVSFIFSGISALLGALVYLLYQLITAVIPPVTDGNGGGMKVVVFTVLAGVSGICIYFGNRLLMDVKGVKDVDLQITLDGVCMSLHLLVDTGNLVTDPVSGRKVVIISQKCGKRLFGSHINELDYLSTRRRWICVHSVSGVKSLQAFLPEKMVYDGRVIDALLAIGDENDYQGYEGIFPSTLL